MSRWSCLFLDVCFGFFHFPHFGILSVCFTVPWIKRNYIVWMSFAREKCQNQRLKWRWNNKIWIMWTTEKWLDLKQLLPWMACTGHFGYLSNYKNGTGREMRAHKEKNLFSLVHKHFRDQLQNVVELQRASWNNLLIKKCSEPILSTVARSQHTSLKMRMIFQPHHLMEFCEIRDDGKYVQNLQRY